MGCWNTPASVPPRFLRASSTARSNSPLASFSVCPPKLSVARWVNPSQPVSSPSRGNRVGIVTQNAELTCGSHHADPNRLALTFWIPQPLLLRLFLFLEGLRQRRKLAVDVFEEQPPLDDFGHCKFIAQAPPTCGT